jgi:hypothetical protein
VDREESRLKLKQLKPPPLGRVEEMSNPNYKLLSLRRDLERRNLSELKSLAKKQGLGVKDAAVIGNAQRRSTWIKLLIRNAPQPEPQPEKPKPKEVFKPKKPATKQRTVYGLKRLPQIKTVIYSYGGVKS